MQISFNDLPIRQKLVVLLGASAAIALLISSVMTVFYIVGSQRDQSLRHLRQVSDIAGENLRAAVAFRDDLSAGRILQSLHADPDILFAAVHDEQGRAFAEFIAPGLAVAQAAELRDEAGRLALARRGERQGREGHLAGLVYVASPIVLDGALIGGVTLVSSNHAVQEGITRHLSGQALISVVTLALIVLISIRLQRIFTTPILRMIEAIRAVADTKDYSVSLGLGQRDEFSQLYSQFNAMLAEVRERDDRLMRQASTDALTGLPNRHQAFDTLTRMRQRAARRDEWLGVVVIDVDHFKRINDTHGHPVGDRVLRVVAQVLQGAIRPSDLVARTGGEEFLLLCEHGDPAVTEAVAERVRAEVERADIVLDERGQSVRVTISAGWYAERGAAIDTDGMLRVADAALYRAKRAGRNRVCMAVPGEVSSRVVQGEEDKS